MGDTEAAPGSATPNPPVAPGTTLTFPPGQPQPAPAAPQYVTKADFESAIAQVSQKTSDLFGGLRNDLKGLIKAPDSPKPDAKPPEPKPDDSTLAERVKSLEAREKTQLENLRRTSIKAAAMSRGIPEKNAERFAAVALLEHGEKVFVDDGFAVHYRDSETKTTPITDWVNAYLQTDEGALFKPSKFAPNAPGLRGGRTDAPTEGEFAGLNLKQVMADPEMVARAVKVPGLMEKLRRGA